jgi:hypothetical protein
MMAPVRELDDNAPSNRAPETNHAPEQPGRLEDGGNPYEAPSVAVVSAPEAPGPSGQPWKRKTPRQTMAHDIAAGNLPTEPALAPDRDHEPESPGGAVWAPGRALPTLAGMILVLTAASARFLWTPAPDVAPPSHQPAPAADGAANPGVANADAQPTARPSAAGDGGQKGGADAALAPTARATPTPPALPAEAPDIPFLLKNGAELMANADIAAARLMFQHAAEAGSAEAAFALAETYDPFVSRKAGRREAVTADVALARRWYEKAGNLGSAAARERIVRLTQLPE